MHAAIDKIKKSIAPIGMTYVRFAGMAAPTTLFGGTWQNISGNFAGRFFRAEGAPAEPFGGSQKDAIRPIKGQFSFQDDSDSSFRSVVAEATGVFASIGATYKGISSAGGPSNTFRGYTVDFDVSRQITVANENRPINSTIQIYKRVA